MVINESSGLNLITEITACVLLQQLVLQTFEEKLRSEASVCLTSVANASSHKIPAGWSQNVTKDVPILTGARILWNNL